MTTTTEIVLPGLVEPDGLRVTTRELPAPGPGQALLRVEASGISFAEQQMRRGKYYDQPSFPFVPGYDVVGTVLEAPDPALVGRRVAAMTKIGGWSSHLVVDAADLVPVPAGLDAADAETFVVNGITAWQMLHRKARVRPGGTILVHGASGGVGTTLVQLARAAGIHVIGTASARNADVVTALGATALDYRGDVPAQVRALAPGGVDAVFDHVGGPGIVDSFRLLAPGGAGGVRQRVDEGHGRQPAPGGAQAGRPPAVVERPAEPPPHPLLQRLGRQAKPPEVPRAPGGGPHGGVRPGGDGCREGPGGGEVPADGRREGTDPRGVGHGHGQGRPRAVE